MLILGIETSAKACSAALCRDGELLAQSYERTGLTHSRTLLPMIENMLSNTETPKDAIDMVAVAQGPGSFTGIRIGISTAKGLCWGLDIPAVGVSTLEAMAQSARFVPEGTIVCPAMDARRSQLYNALFTVQNGALVRLTEDRAIAADALGRRALRQRKERLGPRRRLGDLRKGAEGTWRFLHRGSRGASLADGVRRVSRGAEQNPDRSGRPAAGLSSSFPGRTRAAEPHERSLRK